MQANFQCFSLTSFKGYPLRIMGVFQKLKDGLQSLMRKLNGLSWHHNSDAMDLTDICHG